LLALASILCRMPLIIRLIIQTIRLYPSGAVWADSAPNVSRLDPSGAVQIEAEHPTRNRKVEGSNPSSGSKTAGQRSFLALLAAQWQQAVIPLGWITRRRRARPASLRRSAARLSGDPGSYAVLGMHVENRSPGPPER
jgi:hypothetical protein